MKKIEISGFEVFAFTFLIIASEKIELMYQDLGLLAFLIVMVGLFFSVAIVLIFLNCVFELVVSACKLAYLKCKGE